MSLEGKSAWRKRAYCVKRLKVGGGEVDKDEKPGMLRSTGKNGQKPTSAANGANGRQAA